MNKDKFWIRIGVVAILLGVASLAGVFVRSIQTRRAVVDSIIVAEPGSPKKPASELRAASQNEPEVIVRFKPGVDLEEIKKLAALSNDRIEDKFESVSNLVAIDDLDDADAEEVAKQYSMMSDVVLYAEPNNIIELQPVDGIDEVNADRQPSASPNDPLFEDQWALNNSGQEGGKENADIKALKAWETTKGTQDVVVAVLDTGVDYTHTDLVANIWHRPDNIPAYIDDELGAIDDSIGFNADANTGDPMDDNGHGTHCAGIIGAEGDNGEGIAGVNWKVEIMPLKFLSAGGFGSTKNAIEAINYAIDRKKKGVNVRIISASWGSTLASKALEDAIRAAGEQGILFVAAAGNSSTDNDRRPHYPSNYDLPNVISVAALDRNDQLASFSNFGPKTVHIAAPGKEIVSTWLSGQFREASGTSMATPQVSGVAALILAANPDLDVAGLREKILKSADSIDSLAGKVENGAKLNAANALE
ncbi:MAG: S8 family peptidase [Pyrinomonadaceae bacterium]